MIQPGPLNLITDVEGIRVGNAADEKVRTGVTVVVPDDPVAAAVDVRGGAPGTRDTDALQPTCVVDQFDAIILSGGSVFGLEAASAVTTWLAEQGRGVEFGTVRVPVAPSAVLFDLANGGDKDWGRTPPFQSLAWTACENLGRDFALGNVGAGFGATAGPLKGGLGSVSAVTEGGLQVGALVAANPFGSVTMPGSNAFWAWPWENNGEFGGLRPMAEQGPAAAPIDFDDPFEALTGGSAGGNTTLGVVATNMALDKAQAQRVAIMAQDGISRAIRPVHTPFDGDTIFVISTGRKKMPEATSPMIGRLGMMAADCVARAIGRGVYAAEGLGEFPGYKEKFTDG